jgi:hypothetical protein
MDDFQNMIPNVSVLKKTSTDPKLRSLQIFKPSPSSSDLETFEKCKLDWEIDVKDLYAPAMNDPLILNDFSTLISTNFDQQQLLSKQNEMICAKDVTIAEKDAAFAKKDAAFAKKDAAFQSMQEKMQKTISDQQETMQKLISDQQETINRLIQTNLPIQNLTSQPNILPVVQQVPNLSAPLCNVCKILHVTAKFSSHKWKAKCNNCLLKNRNSKRRRTEV